VKREWLFEVVGGLYVSDQAEGFAWGPGELNGGRFCIVLADLDDDTAGKLRRRELKLTGKDLWLRDNIWTLAGFGPSADKDRYHPRTFINLRTGQKDVDEDAAWALARTGDKVFVTSNPDDPDCPGWCFKVTDPATRRAEGKNNLTLPEAEAWLS
jgi:hypothetical protein